jgi:hypothetical protein
MPDPEIMQTFMAKRTDAMSYEPSPGPGGLLMSVPHAGAPQILPRPACTPSAIRAVLAANADAAVLQQYDEDLDAAFEQAREQGDLTPLVQTVKRWWFEADAGRDPRARFGV